VAEHPGYVLGKNVQRDIAIDETPSVPQRKPAGRQKVNIPLLGRIWGQGDRKRKRGCMKKERAFANRLEQVLGGDKSASKGGVSEGKSMVGVLTRAKRTVSFTSRGSWW